MAGSSILLLETYPSHELPYDGLSGVFNRIKGIGSVVPDTSMITGAKVLVCGIAHTVQNKISCHNYNVVFTTFESDQLPAEWVKAINQYQHCIVPHITIKEMFCSSGISIPISVIHQGYQRFKRAQIANDPRSIFNVGFLGVPVNRKNLLKLYEACRQLQVSAIPHIRLHVHVSSSYDWLDLTAFQDMKNDDMVSWSAGKYTVEQLVQWYHKLSCYVYPSSGEGWSYTPRESVYMGIPTILSDIPVHRELIESGFAKVIPVTENEPADFGGVFYGNWAKVEVAEIRDAIWDVYNRYEHFKSLSTKGTEWISDKWQNEDMILKLREILTTHEPFFNR